MHHTEGAATGAVAALGPDRLNSQRRIFIFCLINHSFIVDSITCSSRATCDVKDGS